MGGSKPSKPEFQTPKLTELSLPELRTALTKFMEQEEDFQGIQDVLTSSASKKIDALETIQPGYKAGLGKAQQVADSYASGLMPDDVAGKISRSAAFKGLNTGLQGSSRQGVEARDLGLTSIDLQSRGLAMQGALRGEANQMMPLQAMNLAFTPQGIRAEDVGLAEYNNKIKNQQATMNADIYNKQQLSNYQYDQKYGGSPLGGILGGAGGMAIGGAIGSVVPGIGTVVGMGIGSALGGGIAGSFGGAQGQGMGGIFGNVGSMLGGFGAGGGNLFNGPGTFSSLSQAQMAAPYANSFTQYEGGFVPRARTP